jgi:hypothetical protein
MSEQYPETWPGMFKMYMERNGHQRDEGKVFDDGAFFEVSPGVKKFFNYQKEFTKATAHRNRSDIPVPFGYVKGTVNHFANGESRWLEHESKGRCIEDFADSVARESWPRYHIERDASGRIICEGPEPFRSDEERQTYEREFGFTSCGAGDLRPENPYKQEFETYPELRAMFPEFDLWGKRGRSIQDSDLREDVVNAEAIEEVG